VGPDRLDTDGLVDVIARIGRRDLVSELVAAVERTTIGELDDDLALVLLEDSR
jgi:hypothetical protein